MDWLEKLYSPIWNKRFQARAASLYGHLDDYQTMAEDAASMTAMKLRDHSEADATDALILSVFKNALTDCVRERHGFPRPRKWLEDIGDIGKRLFKVICLEGKSRQQLGDWVETEYAAQALALSIFDKMQEAQECSPWRRHMARENTEDEGEVSPFANLSEEGDRPEDHAAFDQVRHFIDAVAGAAGSTREADQKHMQDLAERKWEELGLDAQDRLVVMAYMGRALSSQGRGESEATEQDLAHDLGLSVPQIRNRRKKVLAAMRDIFS